jgi:hypothetical protein
MKKSVPRGIAVVAVAAGLLGFSTMARAQDDGAPPAAISHALVATVDYGNNIVYQPEKAGTDFGLLGVRTDQAITISVTFPVENAGQAVSADPLDGGLLTVPEGGLTVGTDGLATFQFQGGFFGACRINVHLADDANFVRLWVVDPDCPDCNPADLAGGY